jgi:hypothetical protein
MIDCSNIKFTLPKTIKLAVNKMILKGLLLHSVGTFHAPVTLQMLKV